MPMPALTQSAERNADRQPFRNIVKRYGNHKQNRTADSFFLPALFRGVVRASGGLRIRQSRLGAL